MGQAFFKKMDNKPKLSVFRRKKLLCEFNTFYDLNKDGAITESDFNAARLHICKLNGWPEESEKFLKTKELFDEIWTLLRKDADLDSDDKVTADEWISLWEKMNLAEMKGKQEDVPKWLSTYMWFRFNMFDRTGDGEVDADEFSYVLEDFGIPQRQSHQAFLIITQNGEKKLDFDYFCELAEQYFHSEDVSALGNFITGRLEF